MIEEKYFKMFEEKFKQVFPNLTITLLAMYGDGYLLVEAVEDVTKTDYNAPYYLIRMKDCVVMPFNPLTDIDAFDNAITEHVLYKREDAIAHSVLDKIGNTLLT